MHQESAIRDSVRPSIHLSVRPFVVRAVRHCNRHQNSAVDDPATGPARVRLKAMIVLCPGEYPWCSSPPTEWCLGGVRGTEASCWDPGDPQAPSAVSGAVHLLTTSARNELVLRLLQADGLQSYREHRGKC